MSSMISSLRGSLGVHTHGVISGALAVLEWEIALDHLSHLLFDAGQVLLGERLIDHEVVVEAVVRRGADAELGVRV